MIQYASSESEDFVIEVIYVNSEFITLFFDNCEKIRIILDDIDVTSEYPFLERLL